MAVDRLIARREVHLREKTLWRMLYETVARAEEILGVNIEELDLAARRAPVKAKGSKPRTRRRCPARGLRHGARVLGRRHRPPAAPADQGPHAWAGVRDPPQGGAQVLAPRDVCPDTGLVRLPYGQARALLDATPQSAGCRAQAGTCTNTAILVSPTSARPGPACPC